MKEINDQNITLLPFTIDDFGSLGPIANNFLYSNNKTPSIPKKILKKNSQ